MTDHEKLMLRRHLRIAKRWYETTANDLLTRTGNDETVLSLAHTANVYRAQADDAQRMIDLLEVE